MSMEDPGWDFPGTDETTTQQGGQQPPSAGATPQAPTSPAWGPEPGAAGSSGPATVPPPPGGTPGAPSAPAGGGGGGSKGPNRKVLFGGGAAVLVIILIIVIVVATSGGGGGSNGSGSSTTYAASGSTSGSSGSSGSTSGSSGTSGSSSASSGSAEPSILTVLPSPFSGRCQTVPASERVSGVVDEASCDVSTVSGSGADLFVYDRVASVSTLNTLYSQALGDNGVTKGQGNCSQGQLDGNAPNGSYCEGSYTDNAGNQGEEVIFVGSDFKLGGVGAASLCGANASNGITVLVATSPSDFIAYSAIACSTDSSAASNMQTNLAQDEYGLND